MHSSISLLLLNFSFSYLTISNELRAFSLAGTYPGLAKYVANNIKIGKHKQNSKQSKIGPKSLK